MKLITGWPSDPVCVRLNLDKPLPMIWRRLNSMYSPGKKFASGGTTETS